MTKMKFLSAVLLMVAVSPLLASDPIKVDHPSQKVYDQQLAEQLGADQYGMKSYVLVILKTGPADSKITDPEERQALFSGHFANMGRLAEEGKLAVAGPLMDRAPMRGILVLNAGTLDKAEALIKTDPTVEAGIFVYEMTKLYASAALMQVNEIHQTIQKTEF